MKEIISEYSKTFQNLFIVIFIFLYISNVNSQSVSSDIYSIGFTYGTFSGVNGNALDGFDYSKFSTGSDYGGSINLYLNNFSNNRNENSLFKPILYGFGLSVDHYERKLSEDYTEFGSLEMIPVVLRLSFQTIPPSSFKGFGIGYHFGMGAGLSINNFTKGDYLAELESEYGGKIKVETNTSFVYDLIFAGVDLFFSKFICFSVNGLVRLGSVGTKWLVNSTTLEDFESFSGTGLQLSTGLNFWF